MSWYRVSNPPETQISSSQNVRWAGSNDMEYLLLKLAFPNQLPHQSCQISEIEEYSGRFLNRGLSDRPFSCPSDSDDAWLREFLSNRSASWRLRHSSWYDCLTAGASSVWGPLHDISHDIVKWFDISTYRIAHLTWAGGNARLRHSSASDDRLS